MRLYLEFFKNAFLTRISFKTDAILGLVSRIFIMLIQIAIWRALMKNGATVIGSKFVTVRDMVTYSILIWALSFFFTREFILGLGHKVRSGAIAMDLLKPLDLRLQLLFQTWGGNAALAILQMMPLLIFGMFCFGLNLPNLLNGILFIITIVNGMLLHFLICYIAGLTAFWFTEVRQMYSFLFVMYQLFAGTAMPLWFFPEALLKWVMLLPFSSLYYTPVAIYMGKYSPGECATQILRQFIWLGVFFAVERIIWGRAVRRLEIQGG